MKTTHSQILVIAGAIVSLLTVSSYAQLPTPPTLAEALVLKGGRIVAFQPYQMKRAQQLVVTHTSFNKRIFRAGAQPGAMLVVYSTDEGADYGQVLHQEVFIPTAANTGGSGHVKVFDGFTLAVDRKGIIAVLIGLLLPAVNEAPRWVPLPGTEAISAEIHDSNLLVGLLLPAVQKIREAAVR